ncbi:palmitoyltransferase ZDHHC3-like [Watersipora subatra]|uniref:palmitoyltransferase ZDHHC3-like n=1 Tax=Watersipora subatra TaxID=2589382 RepID=UPI00355C26AD
MVFRTHTFGLACVIITYLCIGYADYVVTVHMIGGSLSYSVFGMMNIIAFNAILGLMVLSHIRAMTCDPGIVSTLPNNQADLNLVQSDKYKQSEGVNGWTICSKCDAVRPPQAHHCRICGKCIKKMDHHCPWINNCIGELNQKYLLMFLFYVVVASVYAASMVATYWLLHPPHLSPLVMHNKTMHTAGLCSIAGLFSIFSFVVGYDKLAAVRIRKELSGTATGETNSQMSTKEICYEVFGDVHPFLWLIPLNINKRRNGARQGLLTS